MISYVANKNLGELCSIMSSEPTLWIPMLSDLNKHYSQNRISFIYIYTLRSNLEYVVGINHNDLDIVDVCELFSTVPMRDAYVYNLKYVRRYVDGGNDVDMAVWFATNTPIVFDRRIDNVTSVYKRWYPEMDNVADAIPVMRLIEYCQHIRDRFVEYLPNLMVGVSFEHYNDVYLTALAGIEASGIRVRCKSLSKWFKIEQCDGMMYSDAMPYTLTGRPVFRMGKVNLSALNKRNGEREVIVSRFDDGRLFEFDYDSFHIRLIAVIVGYDLPEGNVHEYLGRLYFNTPELSPEQYESAKRITFKQVYGDMDIEYSSIPFFARVAEYRENLYKVTMERGFFLTPVGRVFKLEWISDATVEKVFNYMIQAYETEINAMTLTKILDYLYERRSKLILYTYDSFLVDYCPDDGYTTLHGLKDILTGFGFTVRASAGVNYADMVSVTI